MCRSARQSCRLGLTFGQQQRPCKTVGPWRPCGAAVFVPIFTKNFRPSRHALPIRPAVTRIRDHATPVMLAVSTYKFTFRRFSTSKRTREIPASGEHLPPTEQTARGNNGYSLSLPPAPPARPREPTSKGAPELYSNAGARRVQGRYPSGWPVRGCLKSPVVTPSAPCNPDQCLRVLGVGGQSVTAGRK